MTYTSYCVTDTTTATRRPKTVIDLHAHRISCALRLGFDGLLDHRLSNQFLPWPRPRATSGAVPERQRSASGVLSTAAERISGRMVCFFEVELGGQSGQRREGTERTCDSDVQPKPLG